jgi:hypothetical protein
VVVVEEGTVVFVDDEELVVVVVDDVVVVVDASVVVVDSTVVVVVVDASVVVVDSTVVVVVDPGASAARAMTMAGIDRATASHSDNAPRQWTGDLFGGAFRRSPDPQSLERSPALRRRSLICIAPVAPWRI